MADRIKGITIELGGDTTGLNKALKDVNSEIKNTQSQLKDVEKLLKLDPKNTELLGQKQKLLSSAISETKNKLDTLKEAERQAEEQFRQGKISEEQYNALKREVIATSEELKKLEAEAKDVNTAMSGVTQAGEKMQEFGGKMVSAGQEVSKVSAAVVGLGAVSVAAWKEIDEGYDTIAKGTGATGQALQDLQASFDNVFGRIPTTVEDASTAIADINTRFGLTGDALEEASVSFLKFAEVNNTDVSGAIANVSRYMGDAGIDSANLSSVLDQLTAASQGSGLSVDKLSENLTKYGAPMRALGFETKEAIAIFSGWEKAGVNTEIAFSGMKKAIGTWSAQGKDAKEEFKSTLQAIKEAPDIAAATTLAIDAFGQKAGPDLADAIQGGRFEFEEFLRIVEGSAGQLDQTFADTQDPIDQVSVAMQGAKLAASELGGQVLDQLSPIISDLVGHIKSLGDWFKGLSDEQKKMIVTIGLIVAALGPLLIIVGTVISSVGGLITVIGGISLPVLAVVGVIAGLIAIFAHLYATNEEFRQKVNAIWEQIKEFIKTTAKTIQDIITALVEIGKELWDQYGTQIMAITETAFTAIQNTINTVMTFIKDLINVILAIIKGDWEGAWEAIKTLFTNLVNNIKETTDAWMNTIKETIKLALDVVKDTWTNLKEGVIEIVKNLKDKVVEFFSNLKDKAVEIFENLKKAVTEKATGVKDAVVEKIGEAVEWIKALPAQAFDWGKDMIKGMIDGIKSMASEVVDAAKGVADSVSEFLHFTRPDKGPLRYYEEWMPHMMQGLAKGIRSSKHLLLDEIGDVAGGMAVMLNADTRVRQPVIIRNYNQTVLDGQIIAETVNERLGAEI